MWDSILYGLGLIVAFVLILSLVLTRRPKKLGSCVNKHVFITGASTGLGKSLAIKFASLGANLTIIARNEEKLKAAQKDIQASRANSNQKIVALTADVTKYVEIESAVKQAVRENGVTDYVITNAGSSSPGYFLELDIETLGKEIQLNYMGTVHTIKAALPYMVERNQGGHFVLVSSAAAFGNFVGYVNYGSSKRAISALAEGLRNEFQLYGIDVSAFYPTGIDTEGFANENKTKPEETKILEGSSSTLSPDQVAESLLDGLKKGKFSITNEFITELMRVNTNGTFSPRYNIVVDLFLSFVGLLISTPITFYFDWVVSHSNRRKKTN